MSKSRVAYYYQCEHSARVQIAVHLAAVISVSANWPPRATDNGH